MTDDLRARIRTALKTASYGNAYISIDSAVTAIVDVIAPPSGDVKALDREKLCDYLSAQIVESYEQEKKERRFSQLGAAEVASYRTAYILLRTKIRNGDFDCTQPAAPTADAVKAVRDAWAKYQHATISISGIGEVQALKELGSAIAALTEN